MTAFALYRASFVPPRIPPAIVVRKALFIISGDTLAGFPRTLSELGRLAGSAARALGQSPMSIGAR